MDRDRVNILLVDDDPAKLMSYEVVLRPLGANLIKAGTVQETFQKLLATDIGVILMDVAMPELDGFQLAGMIRDHPRHQRTAIIFVSAVHLDEADFLRGYEMGAVDYVPVPVVPEVLRAKVRVFVDLHRKTRELEQLNRNLEDHVAERTAALEASTMRLRQSESRRNEALAAGQMGSWDWDIIKGDLHWDSGQYRITGYEPDGLELSLGRLRRLVIDADLPRIEDLFRGLSPERPTCQAEFRVRRGDGEMRWLLGTAAATVDGSGAIIRISGVTIDITDRKRAEERQALLAREVDHRAKNALAVVQSIVRLSRGDEIEAFRRAIEGRISAIARAHTLLAESRWNGADLKRLIDEEFAPYMAGEARIEVVGPSLLLEPRVAQTIAMIVHELITNAAKYGALSRASGHLFLEWQATGSTLEMRWQESGVGIARAPTRSGFGLKVIQASASGQLSGDISFEWPPEGMRCTMSIPLHMASTRDDVSRPFADSVSSRDHKRTIPGRHILVAEDEVLVAMMIEDIVKQAGFVVEGPFRTLSDALEAASTRQIEAALLDISLGSERIYPVADVLASRGIPFAFVTGYGVETIDRRYARERLLQKPISVEALTRFLSDEGVGASN